MVMSDKERDSNAFSGLPSYLFFWVMFSVVMIPFVVFFVTSYMLLYENLRNINSPIQSHATSLLDKVEVGEPSSEATRLGFLAKAWVALEYDVVLHRHKRASWALATRTWMRFMSLVFGTVLVANGSVFVLGRVAAPQTDANFQWQDFKVSLISSSPGLAMAFLGCLLIAVPNIAKQRISVESAPSYVGRVGGVTARDLKPSALEGMPESLMIELMKKND